MSTTSKIAKTVLPSMFKPQFVNGSWNKPKMSRMQIAKLRKKVRNV